MTNHLHPPRPDDPMRVIQWAMWRAVRPRPDTVWVYVYHADGPRFRSALQKTLIDACIYTVPRSNHCLAVHRAASVARFLGYYVDRSGQGRAVRLAAERYGKVWTRRAARTAITDEVVAACTAAAAALIEVIPVP